MQGLREQPSCPFPDCDLGYNFTVQRGMLLLLRLCSHGCPETHYAGQAALKLRDLPSRHWDHHPHLACGWNSLGLYKRIDIFITTVCYGTQ